jgi:hypothetical protein
MSAAAAIIKDAAKAGVRIRLDGDDLVIKGATPATLDLLRLHKPEIVEHLRVERFVARPDPTPLRRRPWEIDPVGERQEEDGKFFRNLLCRSYERAGLPAPVSSVGDGITRKLKDWRHEDEGAYRCWARNLDWEDDPIDE